MAPYSTKVFHYDAANKLFSAYASDISHAMPLFHRVWADACDEGLILISERTGLGSNWVVTSVDEDEGDVAGWNLVPTDESVRKNAGLKGVRMLIIND